MENLHGEMLTVAEFAEACGCTVACVRKWISERRIDSVKIGPRLVRIPELEVERLFVEGLRPAIIPERNRGKKS